MVDRVGFESQICRLLIFFFFPLPLCARPGWQAHARGRLRGSHARPGAQSHAREVREETVWVLGSAGSRARGHWQPTLAHWFPALKSVPRCFAFPFQSGPVLPRHSQCWLSGPVRRDAAGALRAAIPVSAKEPHPAPRRHADRQVSSAHGLHARRRGGVFGFAAVSS